MDTGRLTHPLMAGVVTRDGAIVQQTQAYIDKRKLGLTPEEAQAAVDKEAKSKADEPTRKS